MVRNVLQSLDIDTFDRHRRQRRFLCNCWNQHFQDPHLHFPIISIRLHFLNHSLFHNVHPLHQEVGWCHIHLLLLRIVGCIDRISHLAFAQYGLVCSVKLSSLIFNYSIILIKLLNLKFIFAYKIIQIQFVKKYNRG